MLTPERSLFHAVTLQQHFAMPCTFLGGHPVIALTSFAALLHSDHLKTASVTCLARSMRPEDSTFFGLTVTSPL